MSRIPAIAEAAIQGNVRSLAQTASLIEHGGIAGRQIVAALFPLAGRAQILGVTGPAGAGKSTLVNACIRHLRQQSRKVAVIAVDPTSSISRGALLGDRIRMMEHSADANVFIRSVATRGQTGGLASCALGLCILLDAAGFDFIFIETIGVGQDEVDVAALAHGTAVVLMPASGDDIQAIKAGIMEIADIFVINKADLPGANQLADEIRFVQGLGNDSARAPIYKVSAASGVGLAELMAALPGILVQNRSHAGSSHERWRGILLNLLRERATAKVPEASLARESRNLSAGLSDPYSAADRLLVEAAKDDADGC